MKLKLFDMVFKERYTRYENSFLPKRYLKYATTFRGYATCRIGYV